eukprot:TRINITY_DN628_c0_g1_i1.p1 TRINITY_DN628_c0_g1~~TRINITY_DN628_c0_g1_i1.p1  ORF type:complete len:334 (+),score=113.84 TRINITY_DN628_c0_g1_i1:85-1002(+)
MGGCSDKEAPHGGYVQHNGYVRQKDRSPLPVRGDRVRVKLWVERPLGGWDGLERGAVGTVRRVDGQVCKVLFPKVGLWHGYLPEMEVLDAADRPTMIGQHTGMWRHERTVHNCSTPEQTEGPLCAHGAEIVRDHWSCCGSTDYASKCDGAVVRGQVLEVGGDDHQLLLLLAAAGAAALRQEQSLISVGDTVRVKPWVTEPKFKWGNVTPGDVGTVREVDGLTCKVHFAKQPSLWTGFVPEMEVMDTSGSPQRGQHAGQWRAGRKHFCCSRPGQLEGPLCMHGDAIVREDHWSCCGQRDVYARCTA